jgi:hypothetical protein
MKRILFILVALSSLPLAANNADAEISAGNLSRYRLLCNRCEGYRWSVGFTSRQAQLSSRTKRVQGVIQQVWGATMPHREVR